MGCPFQITLLANSAPTQYLEVRKFVEDHNHETIKKDVQMLPEKRRLNEEEKKKAAELIKVKGKSMDIRLHLLKTTGKMVTQKDLSNIR